MTAFSSAWYRLKSRISPGVAYSSLAVVMVALGIQGLQTQEAAAFITAIVLGMGYLVGLCLVRDPKERIILGRLFLCAYVIRLLFTYVLFKSDIISFFGGADDLGWKGAVATAWRWRSYHPVGDRFVIPSVDPHNFPDTFQQAISKDFVNAGYMYFSALFFYRLGVNSQLALAFANCFAGALAAVMTYQLGRFVAGRKAAFVAAGAVTLMPSFLIWSALTQKEAWVILIQVTGIYCLWRYAAEAGAPGMWLNPRGGEEWRAYRPQSKARHAFYPGGLAWLAGVIVCVALLRTLRTYAAPMHLMAATLSLMCLFSKRPWRTVAFIFGAGLVGMVLLFTVGQRYIDFNAIIAKNLAGIDAFRDVYTSNFEGSRNQTNVVLPYDIHTLPGATMMILVGGMFVMWAPFPWQIHSAREASSLPDLFPWWILFFGFVVPGIHHLARKRPAIMASIILYTTPLFLFYALSFINVGTTYRMRSQMIPPLLLFAVATVAELRSKRKRMVARRRLHKKLTAVTLNVPVSPALPPPEEKRGLPANSSISA